MAESADGTTEDTSQLLASSREAESSFRSIPKMDMPDQSQSEIAQTSSRLSSSKVQDASSKNIEEGDYSMSFESITDLKNQQFHANPMFDTETISKKEMATFDDSISSISMDERPTESFLKPDESMADPILSAVEEKDVEVIPEPQEAPSPPIETAVKKSPSRPVEIAPSVESPPRRPIIFHESPQHSIQKMEALKTEAPIIVGQPKPEQTFLTFAQLLEMNNQEEEIKSKPKTVVSKSKEDLKSANKPVKKSTTTRPAEKTLKKAILQKANAKVKAPAHKPSTTPVKKQVDTAVPEKRPISPVKKSSPMKSPAAAAEVPRSKQPSLQKESQQVMGGLVASSLLVSQKEEVNVEAEDTRYFDLLKENSSLQKRISDLELKAQKLHVQVDEYKKEAQDRHDEINSIQQQNLFLEGLLQEKASTAIASSNIEHEPEIQKKLDDQEYLIRGYQTENEKLVLQIKELKKTTKDLENRHFLKMEAAQRETATVKTQLELAESSLRKASSISNTQATLTIEELKSSISKLQREMETHREDSKQQTLKYEALIADANKRADEALSSHPEHIKKLVADLDEQRLARERYIIELETKLEWHIGNQDIFNQVQQRIDRYEKTIVQLNKALESQIGATSSSQQRSSNDIKKIKQLESQIADLQEQISHNDKELPDLGIESPRPLIANQQVVVYLKKIIHDMENDHCKFKLEYDENMKELTRKLDEKDVKISNLANQISSLSSAAAQSAVKDAAGSDPKLPIPSSTSSSAAHHNEESLSRAQALEGKLTRRVSELEAELLKVRDERDNAELEISKKIKEKDQMLKLMETRQTQLETEHQQKIVKFRKTNPDLDAVRAELEASISKNTTLALKLELAEKAHQALHDSTLDLMKSSQEQASRMAFEHSKHSMEILRYELKKEQAAQNAAVIESFRKRILDLEAKLAEAQDPNDTRLDDIQTKLLNLDREHQSLLTIHSGCEERLRRSRDGLPPSLQELDRLVTRLYELEASSKARERILKQALETQSNQAEMKNLALQKELRVKDTQIKRYKSEMEGIIEGIQQLKGQQG